MTKSTRLLQLLHILRHRSKRPATAAELAARARADLAAPLGVSYGHSDDLAAFWQALGFREIHRSVSGKARPTSLRLG